MIDTLFFGGIAAAVIALNSCDLQPPSPSSARVRCARCCMSCCRLSTGGADDETARQAHERAA